MGKTSGSRKWRWVVGVGALLIAAVALLTLRSTGPESPALGEPAALDEIDAESRQAMRELLRETGREE